MPAKEKTKEEQQAEEQLQALLQQTKPKGLGQGVTRGVSNIVTGAVGAAGVAVIAPLAGAALGSRSSGLVGGIIGLTGGAVVGALGGAALLVGGAVAGVTQMVQGVLATPEAAMAPSQGKWWNEQEGKWILTDMAKEQEGLSQVPADDKDILGDVQKELDASAELGGQADKADGVVDTFYYDALEVTPTAEPAAIRRRYYVLAKKYHPDRNPDDAAAAEKFKDVAEAYQVLSDPELRARYDKVGKDGLSADKTETVAKVDPVVLFAFLFGSDKFNDYIGRLASATSATVGDSPKISITKARTLQKRRVTRLALKLIEKVLPWTEVQKAGANAEVMQSIEAEWKHEAESLATASFGYEMVTTIGKLYELLATQYQGSVNSGQGLPSISKWAERQKATMDKKAYSNQNKMEQMKATVDMMQLQLQFKAKMEASQDADERDKLAKELEEASVGVYLRVLWTTTVVDITSTLHEVCHMVFFDQSVDKDTRMARSHAVKKLGQIWSSLPEPAGSKEEKDAKKLYEEAAFAAMVETVQRKDATQS